MQRTHFYYAYFINLNWYLVIKEIPMKRDSGLIPLRTETICKGNSLSKEKNLFKINILRDLTSPHLQQLKFLSKYTCTRCS